MTRRPGACPCKAEPAGRAGKKLSDLLVAESWWGNQGEERDLLTFTPQIATEPWASLPGWALRFRTCSWGRDCGWGSDGVIGQHRLAFKEGAFLGAEFPPQCGPQKTNKKVESIRVYFL